MFLDSTDQYCSDSDDFTIVPWMFERHFSKPWDKVAEVCRYRKFVNAKSAFASRKRLSTIISKNASLLGGSRRTSMEILTHRFLERWILACDYIIENHEKDSDGMEVFGKRMTLTMGCWQFLEPDLKAIVHLSGLQLGDPDALRTLDQDKKRRQTKAQALKALDAQWAETKRKIAYLLTDPDQILSLSPALTKALATVEEEVEWIQEGGR